MQDPAAARAQEPLPRLSPTFELRAQGFAIWVPDSDLSFGAGGGLSIRGGALQVVSRRGDGSWLALHAGAGIEPTFLMASPQKQPSWYSGLLLHAPLLAGVRLGLGGPDDGAWSGAVLGVDWQPALVFVALEGRSAAGFSPAGMQLTVDRATIEPGGSFHFRAAAFAIFPLAGFPFQVGGGLGTAWY